MADHQENRQQVPVAGSLLDRIIIFIWYELPLYTWGAVIAIWNEILPSIQKFDDNALPKRTGQTVVLTGGNRGIGLQVLKKLLQLDYDVIFGVRNVDTGLRAINEIRQAGVTTGNAKCFALDLMSLSSVRKFANTVLMETNRIDLLINNAAVMYEPFTLTEDGYELHFQVNHLSHFLLTQLLLPRIKTTGLNKSTNCRVVNVSSIVHLAASKETLQKCLINRQIYSPQIGYMNSKLCQVLSTKYQDAQLQREDANINMYAVHPGLIVTDLWTNMPFPTFIKNLLKACLRNADAGADVIMYAAISPDLEGTGGHYLMNNRIHKTTKVANDLSVQKQIMDYSHNCVNGK